MGRAERPGLALVPSLGEVGEPLLGGLSPPGSGRPPGAPPPRALGGLALCAARARGFGGAAAAAAAAARTAAARQLWLSLLLALAFTAAEVGGGLWAGSLAVLSDAAHMASDVGAYAVALVALRVAHRAPSDRFSWGFQRAEVFGALASVCIVWVGAGLLFAEAVGRVRELGRAGAGAETDGRVMTVVALAGMLANVVQMAVLGGHGHGHGHGHDRVPGREEAGASAQESVSLRAAYVHAVGDLVQSVGVLLAGVVIWARPELQVVDPVVTLLFCPLVIGTTLSVLSQCVGVLLEGAPADVDRDALVGGLLDLSGIRDVHDLHVWSLRPGEAVLAVHVLVDDALDAAERRALLDAATLTCAQHGVKHTTIQMEAAAFGGTAWGSPGAFSSPDPAGADGAGCTQLDD